MEKFHFEEGSYIFLSYYWRLSPSWYFIGTTGEGDNYKQHVYGYGTTPFSQINGNNRDWYLEIKDLHYPYGLSSWWHFNDEDNPKVLEFTEASSTSDDDQGNIVINPCDGYAKVEFEMKVSSVSGNGYIKMWNNGQKVIDYIGRTDGGTSMWLTNRYFQIGTYARPPSSNNWRYFSDIYLDTKSRARVVIGNNQVYDQCTIRETQIPTSWTDTSITFTVNHGKLQHGQAYLFVLNPDGVIQGTPVTLQ